MALCVKNLTGPAWNEQTATTAASPSTSTPPSVATELYYDDAILNSHRFGLLRRLWREINNGEFFDKHVENGNYCFGDRFDTDYSQNKRSTKWFQLRKYWRHNARRRLRNVERGSTFSSYQLQVEFLRGRNLPNKESIRTTSCCHNKFNDVPTTSFAATAAKILRNCCGGTFGSSSSITAPSNPNTYNNKIKYEHSKSGADHMTTNGKNYLPEQYFSILMKQLKASQISLLLKAVKSDTIKSYPHGCKFLRFFQLFSALPHDHIPVKLYTNTTCPNSRRRTICDSMPSFSGEI
ncbi:hypothetical protein EVAR_70211_1 [Eumeta japonica]|uniref:Uncharacterized protein n=1 Tax=Eumeta variegata TaxID=151549 RepID=A0A4C1T5V9_EUMVA|nr:hypothetical protein EVAR_70211_1 [Eumeta japonica]